VNQVKQTHQPTLTRRDRLAYWTVRTMRFNFDLLTGFLFWKNEQIWLNRIIFLETIAAVPGSIAATLRHLASLRRMKRDHGWIHTLLEEAENERMHLLTMLKLRQPGRFMRAMVFIAQGIFFNFFWMAYLVDAKFCHRMVGYLEEEAVYTYTKCLASIDKGQLWKDRPAPDIAITYWKLKPDALMRDVIAMIRADEAHHRNVNHDFASLDPESPNPFKPGH